MIELPDHTHALHQSVCDMSLYMIEGLSDADTSLGTLAFKDQSTVCHCCEGQGSRIATNVAKISKHLNFRNFFSYTEGTYENLHHMKISHYRKSIERCRAS